MAKEVGSSGPLDQLIERSPGGAGTTSWERCCLGLPSLVIVTADNQRAIADELAGAGAAKLLGWHGDVEAENVSRALENISADPTGLRRMGEAAGGVCDGLGAKRIRERMT